MMRRAFGWLTVVLGCVAGAGATAEDAVNESARRIPVAYDVDVVVVGGGTGAVSAAIAAAQGGAKVFLAAPYPYLGDDMTATLRLWLEPGETPTSPLAQRVFDDRAQPTVDPDRLAFTYQTDQPSAAIHRDTTPPGRLTDGVWDSAASQSVQYDNNVQIIADLGRSQPVRLVRAMVFRRPLGAAGGSGFDVQRITVSLSDDQQQWRPAATIENDRPPEELSVLTAPIDATARYVRLGFEKPEGFERMLLGEIEIVGPPQSRDPIAADKRPAPRPMHVKGSLDDELLAAGVQYLYSCYATDVLRDADGKPRGIVMANRAGRQAVLAKTIIDATPRATVARLAGAAFRPYPGGTHTFRRVVIGGRQRGPDYITSRLAAPSFHGPHPNAAGTSSGEFPVIEYTMPLPIEGDSYAAYMQVDQQARTMTYDPEQQFTSDELFEIPPDPMHGRQTASGPWASVESLPLGAFQPADVERLYVLGGCADVSREQAEKMLRPVAYMDLGQRLGAAAASDARAVRDASPARLPGQPTTAPAAGGDVLEPLTGVRPTQHGLPTVTQDARALPVLGRYDVLVVGGGTGGAPAGIAAARAGAKTLVVEYLHGLGGVGTIGAISSYYWGNRVGFTATVQDNPSRWVIEQRIEWYRQELLKAGADLWYGVIGCGAYVQDDRVIGAVVATPFGRGVVLAHTVIDATGNSDVAASAGAQTDYTDASEFGMQGTGLPGLRIGGSYNNTDFTIVDETDMVDIWQLMVYAKGKYPDAFDHGRLIDTRERRRIVGDARITLIDQLNERTYPDTVCRCWSNFDTHGYTVDPYLLLEHPDRKGIAVNIPFRAMLPRGLDGIIVTGLSISAHRDAVPLIRMQADIQNGGYAAGLAAAMAAATDQPIRRIDVKALQRQLVDVGNLPDSVLTDQDSFPLSDERIAAAVQELRQGHGAAVIMTAPDRALPLLRTAWNAATTDADRLTYARVLAVLGDDSGLDVLLEKIRTTEQWDEGWNYRGMGQFGAALSELDNLIVAAGRAGNPRAVPVIVEKLNLLDASVAFSHHRAAALALELLRDPSAAEPLARVLAKPQMTGYAQPDVQTAIAQGVPGGANAEQTRRESLRELMLARALYRCGDHDGRGQRILRQYVHDLRGHLARHATAVLDAGP